MKNIIINSLVILFITSCETIDGPYLTDTNNNDNPSTSTKKVLIEDFTGHLCPNCPDAARELEAIHNVYGDQIIAMAIHVTKSFAKPYPLSQAPKFQYDFRTQWGDNWDSFFGISSIGLPRGMVNRIGYTNGEHALGKNEWLSIVQNELDKTPDFKIDISSNITSNNNGSIDVSTTVLNNISGSYNLIVCLTENNITNWQKDGSIEDENYVHNHVLRSVLFDDQLANTNNYTYQDVHQNIINFDLEALEQYNINYSTNIAEQGNGNAGEWEANNLSIIAYIYNTTNYEIIQVEEIYLIN